MSLVAYGNSSESEISDSEILNDKKSNEISAATTSSTVLSLEIIDSDDESDLKSAINVNSVVHSKMLKALPKPTKKNDYDEQDELEDIVKPKSAHISDAPKPPLRKKKKIIVDFSVLNKVSVNFFTNIIRNGRELYRMTLMTKIILNKRFQ